MASGIPEVALQFTYQHSGFYDHVLSKGLHLLAWVSFIPSMDKSSLAP